MHSIRILKEKIFPLFMRIYNMMFYEIRRSIAKKKVLAAILLIFIAQFSGLFIYRYALDLSRAGRLPITINPAYGWIFVFFLPGFFTSILGILIAAGSISEEYEKGTAEIIFSKPITRTEIICGKLLGGLIIIFGIITLLGALAVILTIITFGFQEELHYIPLIIFATFYANLIFYTMAFMLSEVTRNTLISSIVPISFIIILPIIQGVLIFIENVTGIELGWLVRAIPTWSTDLPAFLLPREVLIKAFIISPYTIVFHGNPLTAIAIITGYTVIFLTITIAHAQLSEIS